MRNKTKEKLITQARLKELFTSNIHNDLMWREYRSGITVGSIAGCINKVTGYRIIGIDGKTYLAHRLCWVYVYGVWPTNSIDHIDGNKLNNKIENLRDVTQQENSRNATLSKNNTSGTTGVCWKKDKNKWRSHIKVNWKQIHLGYFTSKEAAIKVRKEAEVKYKFHN